MYPVYGHHTRINRLMGGLQYNACFSMVSGSEKTSADWTWGVALADSRHGAPPSEACFSYRATYEVAEIVYCGM